MISRIVNDITRFKVYLFAAFIFAVYMSFATFYSISPASGFVDLMHKANDTAFSLARNITLMRTSAIITELNYSLVANPSGADVAADSLEADTYKQMAGRSLDDLIEGLSAGVSVSTSEATDGIIWALKTARDALTQGHPEDTMAMLKELNRDLIRNP